jgi:hypothetical protein
MRAFHYNQEIMGSHRQQPITSINTTNATLMTAQGGEDKLE